MRYFALLLLLCGALSLTGCVAAAIAVGAGGGYFAADNLTRPNETPASSNSTQNTVESSNAAPAPENRNPSGS